jgi:excisionase family DNA binding protein
VLFLSQTHEILTADDVAKLLRISKYSVYELAKSRTRQGGVRTQPLPALRIGAALRFRKSDVDAWLERLLQPAQ